MMDDDGRPYNDYCFKNVFDFIIENNLDSQDKYLLNSLVLNDENTLSFGIGHYDTVSSIEEAKIVDEKGAIIDSINPFNGTYVSLGLIDAIGYPNKDFFIKGDEVDYTMRAKKAGAYVATVYNSKYFHPKVSNRKKKKIFGHEMYVYIEAPWKEYYGIRNYVYSVINNTNKKQAKKIIRRAKYKRYLSVLLTKCKKRETIKMIKMGIKDGKNGKLGATIRP